jgi:hypothetical protein
MSDQDEIVVIRPEDISGIWVATDAARELGEAGQLFVQELEAASSIRRRDRRQAKLSALWDDLLSGKKHAHFSMWQLRIADTMIRAALALPHESKPGRRSGPVTPAGKIYEAAVTLVPDVVRDAVADDLRKRAQELAVAPASDPALCEKWGLASLELDVRVTIIAQRIRADADRLAAECCAHVVGHSQGRAGWEHSARELMAMWADLPNLPDYLKKAAHPDVLKASANSYAVQKSRAKKRAVAD